MTSWLLEQMISYMMIGMRGGIEKVFVEIEDS